MCIFSTTVDHVLFCMLIFVSEHSSVTSVLVISPRCYSLVVTTWCYISEPPQWTEYFLPATRRVLVNESAPVRLHCSARGNPAPVIFWTKDGQMLDHSGTTWYTVVDSVPQRIDTYSTIVTSTLSFEGTI